MNFECDGRKEGAQKAPVIFERRRPMLYGLDPIQFILEIMPRNLPAFEIKKVNARERERKKECVLNYMHFKFLRRIKIENKTVSNGRTRI